MKNDGRAALLTEGRSFAVAGIVLAAGAGTRMGGPKGLMVDADGVPWVATAVQALADGGCEPVLVVVGAEAERVRALVLVGVGARAEVGTDGAGGVEVVVAVDWGDGMGASLRSGLRAVGERAPSAIGVIVTLVDTPGVTAAAVSRLCESACAGPTVVARAAYHGVAGHPVLIGREHWAGVIESVTGDAGARHYLAGRDVVLVECADVASGEDFDTRKALGRLGRISWTT